LAETAFTIWSGEYKTILNLREKARWSSIIYIITEIAKDKQHDFNKKKTRASWDSAPGGGVKTS